MIYSDREPALRRRTSRRIGEEERRIAMKNMKKDRRRRTVSPIPILEHWNNHTCIGLNDCLESGKFSKISSSLREAKRSLYYFLFSRQEYGSLPKQISVWRIQHTPVSLRLSHTERRLSLEGTSLLSLGIRVIMTSGYPSTRDQRRVRWDWYYTGFPGKSKENLTSKNYRFPHPLVDFLTRHLVFYIEEN